MYWWKIRRYDSELCHECGRPYYSSIGDTWWHADDGLWNKITGGPDGLLCPPCFTRKCNELGILIYWEPVVSERNG